MATDPVCSMTVEPARAAATRAHDGHTYYFCARACALAFEKEPWKYVGGTREDESSQPKPASGRARRSSQLPMCGPPPAEKRRPPAPAPAPGAAGREVKPAAPESIELEIDGMHCASCVRAIETALEAVPGVSEALVNLGTGRARVEGAGLDAG